jgi:6,7-dimethyl-8-ribityllumazine synthase
MKMVLKGTSMPKFHEAKLIAEGKKFALVVSRFNDFITEKLLSGALDALIRSGAADQDIEVVKVPGSFEIPVVAKKMAKSNRFDAIICLGAVIKGQTPHFDYVAAEVSKGIAAAGFQTGVPIVFGVLTTDTMQQALERAGIKSNLGWNYAMSALEMASLMSQVHTLSADRNGLPGGTSPSLPSATTVDSVGKPLH